MLEYIIVSIDYWEYPTDFLVLQPKSRFNEYPLILGRPWLATIDAYISYREGNMTITNGQSQNQLVFYPPSQPLMIENFPMWIEEEEEDLIPISIYPICTLRTTLTNTQIDEDTVISNFLQS
jgi:hypothetical protein